MPTSGEVLRIGPDKDALTIFKELREASQNAKRACTGDWAENLQQIAGHLKDQVEAAVMVLAGGLYDKAKTAEFGGTPFNVVLPFVNRYISRVTHLVKQYQVFPADDEDDEDAALADERLLNARWQTTSLRRVCEDAIVYACACSHGYVKIEGDATLNPKTLRIPVKDEETGLPLIGADGQPVVKERVIPEGDTVRCAYSPFQIEMYSNPDGIDGSPVVALYEFLTEDEIVRRGWGPIPDNAEPAKTGDTRVDNLLKTEKFLWKVTRLWLKPSKDRPNGEHHVIIGEKVMHSTKRNGKDWIGTWNDKYPLIDFADGLQAGYWGRGRHTAAKPIVKDICIAWSTISQIGAIPGLILDAPEDAVPKIANLRMLLIERPAGTDSIGFHSAPRMPLHEFIIERGIRQIAEIYSQHESTRGQSPGSRFPVAGLKLLAQQDILAESPTGRRYLEAFRQVGQAELGEGRRVWPEKMVSALLGENGRWQRQAFYKENLLGNVDVRIVPNRDEPSDRDSMRKWLVEAGKAGLIDKHTIRQEFGKPSKEDLSDPTATQENNAKDEEKAFESGSGAPTQWYDDHVFHFTFHMRRSAKRGAKAQEAEVGLRRQHAMEHLVKCPAAQLPQLLPLVPQDMVAEVKAFAAQGGGGDEGGGDEPPPPEPEPELPPDEFEDEGAAEFDLDAPEVGEELLI